MLVFSRARTAPLTLLALLLAGAGCSRCGGGTDEEQEVRATIAAAVTLAERNDLGGLMRLTTDDFVAHPGSVGRREVRGVLLAAFKRYGRFSIRHPRPGVDLGEDRRSAAARVPFVVIREGAAAPDLGGLVDDAEAWMERVAGMGDAYYLELEFRKDGGEWRVSRARIRGTRDRWSL